MLTPTEIILNDVWEAIAQMSRHKVIIGDSRRMDGVADESVHLVVTSPPYWQLKDYGPKEQIGYNDTYQNYIDRLTRDGHPAVCGWGRTAA
jgi:DNA modification methylase